MEIVIIILIIFFGVWEEQNLKIINENLHEIMDEIEKLKNIKVGK